MSNDELEGIQTQYTTPPALYGHKCSMIGGEIAVFGGMLLGDQLSNQFWLYNVQSRSWRTISQRNSGPSARNNHGMVAVGYQVFVFGGETSTGPSNDLWYINGFTSKWTKIETALTPSVRTHHILVSNGTHLIMFGGKSGSTLLKDLWVFDLRANTWTEVPVSYSGMYALSKTAGCQGALYLKSRKLILTGCCDVNAIPTRHIHSLDLNTMTWDPFIASYIVLETTAHATVSLQDDSIYVFGGDSFGGMNNFLSRIRYDDQFEIMSFKSSSLRVTERAESCMVHYGDEMFVFGGNGGISSENVRTKNKIFNGSRSSFLNIVHRFVDYANGTSLS